MSSLFRTLFDRHITSNDFSVLFACNDKKFSCHIVLVDGSFFEERETHVYVAYALDVFLHDECEKDDTFKQKMLWDTPKGVKSLVDFAVYHKGQRSWRTFTGMKIPAGGVLSGSLYTDCRPLLPSERDMHRPWSDFFVTAVTRKEHLVCFSEQQRHNIIVLHNECKGLLFMKRRMPKLSISNPTLREAVRPSKRLATRCRKFYETT